MTLEQGEVTCGDVMTRLTRICSGHKARSWCKDVASRDAASRGTHRLDAREERCSQGINCSCLRRVRFSGSVPVMGQSPTTYWDYIKIEELLSLQSGREETDTSLSNDEVLFITVHQIDELWFKLAIRELVHVRDLFASEHVAEQSLSAATRGLRRAGEVFRQLTEHFALMETMTTRDYLSFRDKLSPASGFQSAQLREIEILMGLEESDRVPLGNEAYMQALRYPDGRPSPASQRVERRLADVPSLKGALEDWLFRTPIDGSTPDQPEDDEVVSNFIDKYCGAMERDANTQRDRAIGFALTEEDADRLRTRYEKQLLLARKFLAAEEEPEQDRTRLRRVRASLVFIESYRELPLLAWPREILESVVQLEQRFTIFRQRHARMVERMIGRRTGTGGSAGVAYLDATALKYRVFTEFWAVRSLLLRAPLLPPLERADFYDFARG